MEQITNPRIQPLLLMKDERPENLILDKMKYYFSKLFCPPSKTDLESEEEWATKPVLDFVAPQHTNETE